MSTNNQIEEILTRGVSEVIDKKHLEDALKSGKKLRVKLGIDPTSPNLHLGRSVPLLKLKDFQALGHQIVFIVGDFTGLIGDTSDKESERPMLTADQVKKNMESYVDQAAKILDIDKVEINYNSEWLGKLSFKEIGEQADMFSLSDFISRENIKKRLDSGKRVSLRELIYPLMQGYDSVMVKADVELGGTDQRFNLLAGRSMQPHYDQPPQDILMNNLILGTDGRKMSSSWENTVNLTDSAREMFGKVMSIPDDLIVNYFIHTTRTPMEQIAKYESDIKSGANPRDIKLELASTITEMYHGKESAEQEREWFIKTFSNKTAPTDIPVIKISSGSAKLFDILQKCFKEEKSNSDLRRLLEQKAVSVDGKIVDNPDQEIDLGSPVQIKVGKRNWFKVEK